MERCRKSAEVTFFRVLNCSETRTLAVPPVCNFTTLFSSQVPCCSPRRSAVHIAQSVLGNERHDVVQGHFAGLSKSDADLVFICIGRVRGCTHVVACA